MPQRKLKWREPPATGQVDELLASRYPQLIRWGAILTRGDAGKAEEIVQELCLYFTLTRPDLTDVANVDGYLYTSLRNIYLSGLARASREALHFVSVAEFDSFDFALAGRSSSDPRQMQNDLRRICAYSVWRKESSKSASYFILHFFHGYGRQEIAQLACLPISAIYNKLKSARTEVKFYLESPDKLRIAARERPPEPVLPWKLVSSAELFHELRKTILQARPSPCLKPEELLAQYRNPTPLACSLLAHIVSCEPCLGIVDRHFRRPTLEDREPLDCLGSSSFDGTGSDGTGTHATGGARQKALQKVRKQWERVREHRPRTLSIAVNGSIVAFHDVRTEYSSLSARIENPESNTFVEVFSEQNVRLALLSVIELPPDGAHVRTQRVELSDDRWLELGLRFDGLGLNGEVSYFDPALAGEAVEEELAVAFVREPALGIYEALRRLVMGLIPSSAAGWAVAIALLACATGYVAHRRFTPTADAVKIINESVKLEDATLQGQTEHEVLHVEEVAASGKVLQKGVVDLWKDGDGGRYLRRLYDGQHKMLAVEWRKKTGDHGSRGASHSRVMGEFWDQDLSARAFRTLAGTDPGVKKLKGGYELTTTGPVAGHPQLVSETLVLDTRMLPIRAVLLVRAGSDVHELRFVRASYERKPQASVPDSLFDPERPAHEHLVPSPEAQHGGLTGLAGTDVQTAELQVAVLYQLNQMGADTGLPIAVSRANDGHIQVVGTVADDGLKQEIVSRLNTLPNHPLLQLRLMSAHDSRRGSAASTQTISGHPGVYDVNQIGSAADTVLQQYFQSKGLSGEQLTFAKTQFSHDVLSHAQRSLQHAYALDRLGRAVSALELQSISQPAQAEWTEMVGQHAASLEEELHTLTEQMKRLSPAALPPSGGESAAPGIASPPQFSKAAGQLLEEVQELNRAASRIFASGFREESQTNPEALAASILQAVPLRQAENIRSFAVQLSSSAAPAATR